MTKQLRQTFFSSYIIYFHIANQLYQHSHTSRTIASSQYHPRETRPLLGEPNLYKNCYIGFAYVEFVSYITRNLSMFLLIRFFTFSYFFFSFHIVYEIQLFYLLIHFLAFSCFFFSFHILYEVELFYLLIRFLAFSYFFCFSLTSYII